MKTTNTLRWSDDRICFRLQTHDMSQVAAEVYQSTCRTDTDAPGFCLLRVGNDVSSHEFRQLMIDLKTALGVLHTSRTNRALVYLSAARFDQQSSTKPHLDGGPEECFLMLGYEPSDVASELVISDYTKCAFDLGLTPQQFMTEHNPMFPTGQELLDPYSMRVPCFSSSEYQIVCINNSFAAFSETEPAWQGVLHTATVFSPNVSKRRVINSVMIASAPVKTSDSVTAEQQLDFVATTTVRRRGYDNLHLSDDA